MFLSNSATQEKKILLNTLLIYAYLQMFDILKETQYYNQLRDLWP